MPVFLFLGEDDFSKGEALAHLKADLGPPEMAVPNTSTLEADRVSLDELVQVCSTVPFLAPGRLVVVTGLLARFEPRETGRRAGRGGRSRHAQVGPWETLRPYLETQLPPTTTLVFMDAAASPQNPLLADLRAVAQVRTFPRLSPEAVRTWIREQMRARDQAIAPGAVEILARLVGNDLWTLSQEVEKLSLFTQGSRPIEAEDVRLLVSVERETTVFVLTDAVLEGRTGTALTALESLLQGGATAGYLLTMLGRQVRLLLEAHELLGQRVGQEEIGRRLGVGSGFVLRKLLGQARSNPVERLYVFHQALLDTDLAIKRGVLGEVAALELLATQISGSSARRGPGRDSAPGRV